jgi:branched-chain amino acid transport system ATP-binding protein
VLRADELVVRFGGVMALAGPSLEVSAGRVTGLIGPNGAGKSTAFNVLSGLQRPASGRVLLDGSDITRWSPQARAKAGIARTFQRLEVFGGLSVRDNVLVAVEVQNGWVGRRTAQRTTDSLLDRVGLASMADRPAGLLPTGMGRLLELARALAVQPHVLLLDEISAGLSVSETAAVGALLGDLAADGMAVLLVEHDMDLVMNACAYVYVLDFGRLIAQGTPGEIQRDTGVQEAYLGIPQQRQGSRERAVSETAP